MWRPSKILIQFILVGLIICLSDSQPLECNLYQSSFPACKCLKAEDGDAGVIDCSGLNLTSVPTAITPISNTIYEMRLNNNNIVRLTSTSFAGLKIRKLDLRGNRISTVEDGTFQGLAPTTTILYIDGDGTSSPPIGALPKLINLRELSMGNYGMTILNTSMFYAFSNLQKLTLENWKLVSIVKDALFGPSNLVSLILNKQNFSAIPVSVLNSDTAKNLKQLTISNTNIQEVTDHAFQTLANLEELDLSQNHINKLDSLSFDGLAQSLKTLNLSGNVLNSNDATFLQALKDLSSLTWLDLSSNEQITSVPNLSQLNSFNSLIPLKLYLHNNKITNIDSLASFGKYLHTLDLSGNSLSSLDSIASLTSVVSLNLSNQSLPTNAWTVIKRLNTLEVLGLSSVGMTSIPDFVLGEMIHLRVLDLSSANGDLHPNRFSSGIPPQALVGPHSTLKELYLSGSSVTKLSPCLLDGYTSLNITMSLDNVICDCNIYWLWLKVRSGSINFPKGQEPKCSSSGKLLADIQQSTEFCSKPPSVQCTNYYFYPVPNVTLSVGATDIQVSWSLSSTTSNINLSYFHLMLDENGKHIRQKNVSSSIRTFDFPQLKNNTLYSVCVTAVYTTQSKLQCESRKTPSSSQTEDQSGLNDSQKIGIIVGCVIGGVVLLTILVAIVYLLFIRRKPQHKSVNLPEQPRKFTTSELPTLTGESKSYAKKKKTNGVNQNDSNMQVVAISDGQTGPARVGRAQMLNSQSSGGKPTSTSSVSSADTATYENDRGALPKVPNLQSHTDQKGYLNMGYKRDSYDEIDPKKETII